jgi:CheY-like chemotaxis protein
MTRLRALVIEDHPSWQRRVRRVLESCGCAVDVASDYDDASRSIERYVYDIVTLDMMLGPEDKDEAVSATSGWTLLVSLLAVKYPGTAIFVISASFDGDPDHLYQLVSGYDIKGFMSKGKAFEPHKLSNWIANVRQYKEAGGRPDTTNQELIGLYGQQPNITKEELLDYCNRRLKIHQKSIAMIEEQQAYYGLDAPPIYTHRIQHHKEEIQRIEEEIAKIT